MQFVKFCLVGVSNTAISLAVYYLFLAIDRDLYIVGNMIGFFVSVLNAYFWNSRFVFHKENARVRTLARTYLVYGCSLLLSTGLLYLFVERLGISEVFAPLCSLAVTVPINFLLNKLWAFRQK